MINFCDNSYLLVVAVWFFRMSKLDEDSVKPHIKINYSNIDGGSGIGPFDGTGKKTYRDFLKILKK